MGTEESPKAFGRGSINLKIQCGSSYRDIKLENVLHVPTFEYCRMLVSAIDKRGMTTTFGNDQCEIRARSTVVATGNLKGSLYVMRTKNAFSSSEIAFVACLQLWNERMALVDKQGIKRMATRGVVRGLKMTALDRKPIREGCIIVKASRCQIPTTWTTERASELLERIHSDVCGPFEVPSLGRSRYFVSFIDKYFNWVTMYLLEQKSEVSEYLLEYEKYAER